MKESDKIFIECEEILGNIRKHKKEIDMIPDIDERIKARDELLQKMAKTYDKWEELKKKFERALNPECPF